MIGQEARRKERVVERIEHQGGDADTLQVGFAGCAMPVVVRIAKAVQRCRHQIVELIQVRGAKHVFEVEKAGVLAQFGGGVVFESAQKVAGVERD